MLLFSVVYCYTIVKNNLLKLHIKVYGIINTKNISCNYNYLIRIFNAYNNIYCERSINVKYGFKAFELGLKNGLNKNKLRT